MLSSIISLIKKLSCKRPADVVIIGFGASGLAVLYNLVKNYSKTDQEFFITIFDKAPFFDRGIAYSTTNPNHLLNVPANRMGIVNEDRTDFSKWLKNNGFNYQDGDFVSRQIYGQYLENILEISKKLAAEKNIKINFIQKEITQFKKCAEFFLIDEKAYKHCALAIGIELKNNPKNFWLDKIENYLNDPEIHILGSGLTAFDAITSLQDARYNGKIFVHSRRGMLAIAHNSTHQKSEPPIAIEDAKLPLSQLFRKFKIACKNSSNWQDVFNSIRPITQNLWQNLNLEKKQRFMRHCFRVWNVHRHRCPPIQYQKIKKLIDEKKLFFTKEKIKTNKVINCTGFDFNFQNQLLKNLATENLLKYDDLKMGVIALDKNLHLMGALNFGTLFETTAMPEITSQGYLTAKTILAN